MMSEYSPAEALDFLTAEQATKNCDRETQKGLGEYAVDLLRSKGNLVFAKEGNWQILLYFGISGGTNTLLTQAIQPVSVDNGSYVALRGIQEQPSSTIELIKLESNAREGIYSDDSLILASFVQGKLHIPGSLRPTEKHGEAVRSVLSEIDHKAESIERNFYLPRVVQGSLQENNELPPVIDVAEQGELVETALFLTDAVRL